MQANNPEPGLWREDLEIHSYDVDFEKRATAEAICRWFLEAAWNHAEQLGVGYAELARRECLWVLARLFFQVEDRPDWGERIQLVTWPRGINGLFALRDFEVCRENGTRLVAGTSSWLILDTHHHRPQRIVKSLPRIPPPFPRMAAGRDAKKLPDLELTATDFTTAIHYSDIDVNLHVNSARYIGWLLDAYSAKFHRDHLLSSIEVNYLNETLWGDSVSHLLHQQSPTEFSHSIAKSDKCEVCRAQLTWKTKPVPSA
jgi:acyl-ACP thioesterase